MQQKDLIVMIQKQILKLYQTGMIKLSKILLLGSIVICCMSCNRLSKEERKKKSIELWKNRIEEYNKKQCDTLSIDTLQNRQNNL